MEEAAKPLSPTDPTKIVATTNGSVGVRSGGQITRQKVVTALIVCLCNMINFMDRYALPGILPLVKTDLNLTNFQAGLLQSSFIVTYVAVAPVVGFMGDRYSRKVILAVGLMTWSAVSFAASYMTSFTGLLIFRCFGGIGEATYSAIGPAIIGDLFSGDIRSRFLALYYFTTVAGSGMGFIIGSSTAALMDSWNWGLRITPILSIISVVMIVLFMWDPPRGQSDGSQLKSTSWKKDVVYLLKNKSFMFSTVASIGVVFAIGAIAVWGPYYVYLGQQLQEENAHQNLDQISLTFGIVTIASGVTGVVVGSFMGQKLRTIFPSADAVICGVGMMCSVPFLYGLMLMTLPGPLWAVYVLCFFGLWFINLNWALVGDILLYVVIPTRRAAGAAFQILACHIFGDATSPFVIGLISDAIKPGIESESDTFKNYKSLEYSLFVVLVVEVLAGIFFLINSCFLVSDRATANRAIAAGMPDQAVLYDKEKTGQIQVFVPPGNPASPSASSGPMVMVKRSSTVSLPLDDQTGNVAETC